MKLEILNKNSSEILAISLFVFHIMTHKFEWHSAHPESFLFRCNLEMHIYLISIIHPQTKLYVLKNEMMKITNEDDKTTTNFVR